MNGRAREDRLGRAPLHAAMVESVEIDLRVYQIHPF